MNICAMNLFCHRGQLTAAKKIFELQLLGDAKTTLQFFNTETCVSKQNRNFPQEAFILLGF